MSQEVQESLGLTTPSGEVVNLFPDLDPIVNPEIRRMVTAYLASGVASPGGGTTALRDNMHEDLVRAYGLCGPHSISRAPLNINAHDRYEYAKLIANPYIVRLIHVAVAAYFNELPLTRNIAVNLIHSYIDDALPDAIDYGIQRGWLVEIEEHGWPDNMRGMPVKVGSLHLRPTRIGIYRTIEAITWIMDCVHRVDDQINRRDFNQSLDTFRDRWPISSTAVAGVKSNNHWQTLGVA